MSPHPHVPAPRPHRADAVDGARLAEDDRLVEDARCGRLALDDPDPLVRFLARLARLARP